MAPPGYVPDNDPTQKLEPVPLDPDKPASATPKVDLGYSSQARPVVDEITPSPMAELGVSGLWQASGFVLEEKLKQLQGAGVDSRSNIIFREMSDNDPTVSAVLFILQMMVRKVQWRVEPFSEEDDDLEAAEFLRSVIEDMETPWEDVIMDVISEFIFGWSCLEIVYKNRLGPDNEDPTCRSAYSDGLVGWHKLAGRAQEALMQWVFDKDGDVLGWWMWPPLSGNRVFLPREKLMLFRTTNFKNNPQGRSLLRGAYTSYYRKTNLERIEAIGIERDLAGLPVLYVDPEILDPAADESSKANLAAYRKILANIRVDEQSYVILPSIFKEGATGGAGQRIYELSLLSTGSRRQNNTDGIIKRYAQNIATVIAADFILLGHEAVGSFALAEQKYDMFTIALGGFLNSIAAVFRRDGIMKLFRINGFPTDRLPKLVPGELEKQDVSELALAIMQISNTGFITPGGMQDENFFRKLMGMPQRTTVPPTPTTNEPLDDENYLSHPDMAPVQEETPDKNMNPQGKSAGSGATQTKPR